MIHSACLRIDYTFQPTENTMAHKQDTKTQKPAKGNDHAVALNAYRDAFGKHYPQYRMEFRATKGDKYFVLINGDNGGLAMDLNDIREATRNFLH